MVSSTSQKGSVHIVIIIVLIIAVLGLLGFVFWQNFLNKSAAPAPAPVVNNETEKTANNDSSSISFSNNRFSFEYPTTGWKVVETTDNFTTRTELESNDYTPSAGMGVDKGAIVSVNMNKSGSTRDAQYDILKDQTFGTENLKKLTLNGYEALSYNSGYEGIRYHTVIFKDGTEYDIIYQFAFTDEASKYMDVYNQVVNSFKLQ